MVAPTFVGVAVHAANAQEPPKAVYYREYLTDACERLDCYFTVERSGNRKDGSSLSCSSEEVGTVEDLVAKLRRELKGVKVEVVKEKSKPPVIHLIDRSLAESKDYALDRRVSLTFHGTLSELLTRLEKGSGGVSEQQMGGFPVPPPSDAQTTTKIKVKDVPVRNVLTQAVLREGYKRCLWDAVTFKHDGKPLIKVRFTGPKIPYPWEGETAGE